jgi:hypothetical protein
LNSWDIVGPITDESTFATGNKIRELDRLRRVYPAGKNWKKRKGFALIRFAESGEMVEAELHWYEAHGIGKVEIKIKEIL